MRSTSKNIEPNNHTENLTSNVDANEVKKFEDLAHRWWDRG